MSELHRLVYYSRNEIPGSRPEVMAHVQQILATSRRNNTACGVTGALMFNRGCFAQILEGPQAALEQTFERIQRDDRHQNVTVLDYAPVAARSFGHWSMAFVGENDQDQAAFALFGAESGFDPERLTAEAVFAALARLVRDEELAA